MANASPSGSSSDSDEDALEIRQRAYDLLNRMGGPNTEEDVKTWPRSPAENKEAYQYRYSSYQQQEQLAGQPSRDRVSSPIISRAPSRSSTSTSSFTEVFVNCVSDACKVASSEILGHQASVLRTGYDNLKSVVLSEAEDRLFASRSKTYTPVTGSFQTVDIPVGYRGRYSDNPTEERRLL